MSDTDYVYDDLVKWHQCLAEDFDIYFYVCPGCEPDKIKSWWMGRQWHINRAAHWTIRFRVLLDRIDP